MKKYLLPALIFLMATGVARADQVILDDLIVDGSACVGFDCVNGESFGFDTIRIKENNLRIRAVDTSSSASFPTNDWQITFNDSANGGANKFSIDDIDGGRTPFTIEAGAPSHSLYVDDFGRLGLGTNQPVVDLHIKSGNTPTNRLEQDGSSGFTPQTWDVAGNEANFFIRDATNGSTLPFRIFPGAPSNALTIRANSGNVGVGTTTPAQRLHVFKTGGNAKMLLERSGGAIVLLSASAGAGAFGTESNHDMWLKANNVLVMKVKPGGNLEMASGGGIYNSGTGAWVDGSSREYKKNIEALSVDEAMEAFRELNPVKFYFKTQDAELKVGFIAEDVPDLVATAGRKGLSAMDLVAVLTKVVQEQQKLFQEQQKTVAELSEKVDQLETEMRTKDGFAMIGFESR